MYEEEARKMKLAGINEEREASLDFVMVDNSPPRGVIPATPAATAQNTNKQIKLPSTPLPGLSEGQTNQATYFNDLAVVVANQNVLAAQPSTITTVNKLSGGTVLDGQTILNLNHLIPNEIPTELSINLTNIDGAEMDGASSV